MTLASSGTISIGGTTATRSIHLELGRSATATSSLGETALRALANDTSGAISMSTFRGKSSAETQTVTVGTFYDAAAYVPSTSWGFSLTFGGGFGSVSDGTLGVAGNSTLSLMTWNSLLSSVQLQVLGTVANSGWTTMTIAGTAFTRASATFSQNTTTTPYTTVWNWSDLNNPIPNPYGTTVGATKAVVFT